MVRLRLTRMGRKKQPFYRIVAADSRAPRDGRFIESIGHYNPMLNPLEIKIDPERVDYWLGEAHLLRHGVRLIKAPVVAAPPRRPRKRRRIWLSSWSSRSLSIPATCRSMQEGEASTPLEVRVHESDYERVRGGGATSRRFSRSAASALRQAGGRPDRARQRITRRVDSVEHLDTLTPR